MEGNHQDVYDTEQWIHEELRKRGFAYTQENWSTELFTVDAEQVIYQLLQCSDLK